MMALAKILCAALCFFIAALVTAKKAPPAERLKYLVLLAFLTAFCCFVNYKAVAALEFSSLIPPDTVTIEATDTKNDASKETSVYLTGLLVNGQSRPIHTTGDETWLQDGGWYKWYSSSSSHYVSGTTQSMSVSVPAGENRCLTFLGNVWKGIGSVTCLGETQVVDFYAPEETTVQVRLPDSPAAVLRTLQTVRLVIATLLLAIELALAVWVLLREATKSGSKNRSLEFFRWILCVIVILHHCRGSQFCGGYLGVDVFFVISGFFLMTHYLSRKASDLDAGPRALSYLTGRLKRILPQHIFAFLCTVLVVLFYTHAYSLPQLLRDSWGELLLLRASGLGTKISVAGVNWYLSALLMASYIIYYLLCRCEKWYLYIGAPVLFLAIMGNLYINKGYLNIWTQDAVLFTWGFWRGLAEMGLGCLTCVLVRRVQARIGSCDSILIRCFATVFELGAWTVILRQMWTGRDAGDFLIPIATAAVLVSMFSLRSYLTWLLDNPLSAVLGWLSFPMYLNQMIFVRSAGVYYSGDYSCAVKFGLVAATMLFSVFSEWLLSHIHLKKHADP